jgi:SRSO17 transposase
MTPEQIAQLGPALTEFLDSFQSCCGERRVRNHFAVYCRGLLSNLPRKSVEPVALAAGSTVRALQLFLTQRDWDHDRLRDQLQQRVAAQHGPVPGTAHGADDLGVIGLIDETSVAKDGHKTPGVQRQYCGALGKVDNCLVTVHLGYAFQGFKTLLDSDLYLPQSWADDRAAGGNRCREADIPDTVVYRPKTQIALDQVRHALGNGIHFDWLVYDEGYGKDPSFLFGLDALGQTWIGEVPKNFRCWPTRPQYHSLRREFASKEVYNVTRWSPAFIYQDWQSMTFPRQTLIPAVWDIKAAPVYLPRPSADGRPARPGDRTYWLILAWNRTTDEYKYFLSNAPPHTDLPLLLRVAFRRADIEHLFRLAKSEVGLNHFEGRRYVGLMRHLILCQLVLLFLAQQTQHLNAARAAPAPGSSPAPDSARPPRGGKITARLWASTPAVSVEVPHVVGGSPATAGHDGTVGVQPELALCPLAGTPPSASYRSYFYPAGILHPPLSPAT